MRSVAVVVGVLAVMVAVNIVAGVEQPVQVPLLVLVGTFALTFVAKGLGKVLQRPVGSRPGDGTVEGADDA